MEADGDKSGCWIHVTPLSDIWTDFTRTPNQSYSNAYTRLIITSRHTRRGDNDKEDAADRAYDESAAKDEILYKYNNRGWLKRLFWGTHYTINLTAYATIGTFQATTPLLTIDHTSNRTDGERFLRTVVHTSTNYPLFLLKGDGSNATATIRFVVKSSDQSDSSAAAAAIQVAEGAVKILAPQSAVFTTLNAERTKDKAAALDRAVGLLLSKQLAEEQWIDNDIRRWKKGVVVTFRIPRPDDEGHYNEDLMKVGTWKVAFEDPRPSIFSDVQICDVKKSKKKEAPKEGDSETSEDAELSGCRRTMRLAALAAQNAAEQRPEQVLAFNLLNGTTPLGAISVYLKQQAWWDASTKAFASLGEKDPTDHLVGGFCRSIKEAIVTLNLNSIDAGIVTAAVRDRSQLPSKVSSRMRTLPECGYAVTQ